MKKIYQQPLLEVEKMETMEFLAFSVKDGDVTNYDDLLAPEYHFEKEDDFDFGE